MGERHNNMEHNATNSPNVIRDQDAFIMDLHADHAQNTEPELREQNPGRRTEFLCQVSYSSISLSPVTLKTSAIDIPN